MRVYPRDTKKGRVWVMDYSFNGRRVRKTVSTSKKMAELALKEVELRIAKGEFLGVTEPKKMIFDKLCNEYLQFSEANKRPQSYKRDTISVKNLLRSFSGKLISEISASALEHYKNCRKHEVSAATVNRELSCIKHMFNKAVQWGHSREYPFHTVREFKEPPGRTRYLTDVEQEILLNCCYGHIRNIVIMALHTGMRKGEILHLRWSDVDMRNRNITVKQTKNNDTRTLPINDTLYDMLRSIEPGDGEDYVFRNDNGKPYGDIKTGFTAALRRAEIKNFRFHDLRHTYASHLVMRGADIRSIQKLLGHRDITMTMRYSHLSDAHLREVVKKLDVGTNLAQVTSSKTSGLAKH